MAFRISFADDAARDLDLIFDFLAESYIAFGDDEHEALGRAEARLREIRGAIEQVTTAPFRGTRDDDLMAGLRHVTLHRAIVYFQVDAAAEEVQVLAIFYGGQAHRRRMLVRLLDG